jgi:protein-L-isoaspartate(D-aspartate) O-methyltransferase
VTPCGSSSVTSSALDEVDRARFCPPEYQSIAESDLPIPVADGITVPNKALTSLELGLLDLKPTDRVLEIGTGSGYQACVLAKVCAEVVSVEVSLVPREVLDKLPDNVSVHSETDGRFGPVNEGQFDAVLVTAGGPSICSFWERVLVEGGRLVVPIGKDGKFELRKYVKADGVLREVGTYAYLNVVALRR